VGVGLEGASHGEGGARGDGHGAPAAAVLPEVIPAPEDSLATATAPARAFPKVGPPGAGEGWLAPPSKGGGPSQE